MLMQVKLVKIQSKNYYHMVDNKNLYNNRVNFIN